jgi:hypothetical protein
MEETNVGPAVYHEVGEEMKPAYDNGSADAKLENVL